MQNTGLEPRSVYIQRRYELGPGRLYGGEIAPQHGRYDSIEYVMKTLSRKNRNITSRGAMGWVHHS